MHHRVAALILLCIPLAACAPLTTRLGFPSSSPNASSVGASSAPTANVPVEYGDIDVNSSSSAPAEPVSERLLENAVLEIGPQDAVLTLQVFTNQSCGYCAQFSRDELPQLEQDYMQAGKLKVQIALVPLQKYPGSGMDEAAVICAARQGKGLAMHLALFGLSAHNRAMIVREGGRAGVDLNTFGQCLDDPATATMAQREEALSQSLSISLLPTFLLSGKTYVGLPHYADLRGRIDAALVGAQ